MPYIGFARSGGGDGAPYSGAGRMSGAVELAVGGAEETFVDAELDALELAADPLEDADALSAAVEVAVAEADALAGALALALAEADALPLLSGWADGVCAGGSPQAATAVAATITATPNPAEVPCLLMQKGHGAPTFA